MVDLLVFFLGWQCQIGILKMMLPIFYFLVGIEISMRRGVWMVLI